MNQQEKFDVIKVSDLPPYLTLVTDSQDVAELHQHSISDEYRAYFVLAVDGEIIELWGIFSVVPKVTDSAENALARWAVTQGNFKSGTAYEPKMYATYSSAIAALDDELADYLEYGCTIENPEIITEPGNYYRVLAPSGSMLPYLWQISINEVIR